MFRTPSPCPLHCRLGTRAEPKLSASYAHALSCWDASRGVAPVQSSGAMTGSDDLAEGSSSNAPQGQPVAQVCKGSDSPDLAAPNPRQMNPRKLPEALDRGRAKTAPGSLLREPGDAPRAKYAPTLTADPYCRVLRQQSRATPVSREIAARPPQSACLFEVDILGHRIVAAAQFIEAIKPAPIPIIKCGHEEEASARQGTSKRPSRPCDHSIPAELQQGHPTYCRQESLRSTRCLRSQEP